MEPVNNNFKLEEENNTYVNMELHVRPCLDGMCLHQGFMWFYLHLWGNLFQIIRGTLVSTKNRDELYFKISKLIRSLKTVSIFVIFEYIFVEETFDVICVR